MSWNFTVGSRYALRSFPERAVKQLRTRAQRQMEVVIRQAVDDMRQFTESRPSAKSGKEGRVDTGLMLESIAGRTFNDGVDRIIGEFGFLNRQELYFMLQTSTGFQHYLSSEFIEPTFAMHDSAQRAVENLLKGLKS